MGEMAIGFEGMVELSIDRCRVMTRRMMIEFSRVFVLMMYYDDGSDDWGWWSGDGWRGRKFCNDAKIDA